VLSWALAARLTEPLRILSCSFLEQSIQSLQCIWSSLCLDQIAAKVTDYLLYAQKFFEIQSYCWPVFLICLSYLIIWKAFQNSSFYLKTRSPFVTSSGKGSRSGVWMGMNVFLWKIIRFLNKKTCENITPMLKIRLPRFFTVKLLENGCFAGFSGICLENLKHCCWPFCQSTCSCLLDRRLDRWRDVGSRDHNGPMRFMYIYTWSLPAVSVWQLLSTLNILFNDVAQ
jgi:hypothetical protein